MPIEDYSLIRLSGEHIIKPFNCDDHDLNGFLFEDAKLYQKELLAVTYLFESESKTIAFYSLLNDKISIDDTPSNTKWRKFFRDKMPPGKQFRSYPAMKIGRLGVDVDHKGAGIGRSILDFIKQSFLENNRTGCKFITVDAYRSSLGFYERNGFLYMTDKDKDDKIRLMYFDLSWLT